MTLDTINTILQFSNDPVVLRKLLEHSGNELTLNLSRSQVYTLTTNVALTKDNGLFELVTRWIGPEWANDQHVLMGVIENGTVEMVRSLNQSVDIMPDYVIMSPIVNSQNPKMLQYVLDARRRTNILTTEPDELLVKALCCLPGLDMIKYIIQELGADPSVRYHPGAMTPLELAANNNQVEILDYLFGFPNSENIHSEEALLEALEFAASGAEMESTMWLMEKLKACGTSFPLIRTRLVRGIKDVCHTISMSFSHPHKGPEVPSSDDSRSFVMLLSLARLTCKQISCLKKERPCCMWKTYESFICTLSGFNSRRLKHGDTTSPIFDANIGLLVCEYIR